MLRIDGLHKGFGDRTLLDGISLHLHADDRVGLVGRNGAGKTTLLRLAAGLDTPDDGQIRVPHGVRVGYLKQEVSQTAERSVIEEARTAQEPLHELARRVRALEDEISGLGARGLSPPESLSHRYDTLRHEFEQAGGFQADVLLRATLTGLGLGPERWDEPLRTLSGGWLMRVELAKLLLARPQVLLLDEPTNHLDLPSIRWFEGVLASYPGAVVVVSHDRTFLDRHVTRIAEIEAGRLVTYRGNYSAYLEQKAARLAESDARRSKLDRQIRHMERFVERFRSKATKAKQAQSRQKAIDKLRAERNTLEGAVHQRTMRLRLDAPVRAGEIVLRLEDVARAYGDLVVYDGLDLEFTRGERIALVGPNGAGKSTLLRIVAGVLPIDRGTRELGHNVSAAFYTQHQLDALVPSRTVMEELESDAATRDVPRLRGVLGAFLFSGEEVEKRVSVLSGGEKARLALAKLLLGRANLLVLDEPTNHLDIESRDVLTDALSDFSGTMLFVSHDRLFINQIATRVLEVTRGREAARVRSFPGNFDDYTARIEASAASSSAASSQVLPSRTAAAPRRPVPPRDRTRERALRKLREKASGLESEIETAEVEIERLGWQTADPDVARDGDRMRALALERVERRAALARLYSEWERVQAEIDSTEHALGPASD